MSHRPTQWRSGDSPEHRRTVTSLDNNSRPNWSARGLMAAIERIVSLDLPGGIEGLIAVARIA